MAADKVLERAWGRPKEPERSDPLEQRIARMTPEERARDALELAERVRRRLAEYRMTIEHEREVSEDEASEVEEDRAPSSSVASDRRGIS